ncbi:MAG: hypothetical protein JWP35_3466 [Caulobacter sp.]|jgi:hypothetical protein|nr:hypothetical protein [Caulobacter sp.]
MRRRILTIVLPVILGCAALAPAAVTSAAPSAESGSPPRACFYPRDIRSFTQAENDTAINLRIGAKDVYQLTLLRDCIDLKWERAIQVTDGGAGVRICDGPGVEVITSKDNCPVSHIRKLSPEEVAALPAKDRP